MKWSEYNWSQIAKVTELMKDISAHTGQKFLTIEDCERLKSSFPPNIWSEFERYITDYSKEKEEKKQKEEKKEIKRVYSDIDPYGEEKWEE